MVPAFTIAFGCILFMAALPIVCAGIAKSGKFGVRRSEGGYDNHDPRRWLEQQSAWRARANNAQANTFEALPFFFAAVITAHLMQAPQGWVDGLAVAFVVLRLAYVAAYLADRAIIRSLVWVGAWAVNAALLLSGIAR